MSGLLELLQRTTSPQERYQSLLGLMGQGSTVRGSPSLSGPAMGSSGDAGPVLLPGDPSLASRGPVTLQDWALQSYIQALRSYGLKPGAQEVQLGGSSYRTPQQQAALYAAKPDIAAPPGQSLHQRGLAIDLPAQLQNAAFFSTLRRLGWSQLEGEPWHWTAPGFYG